MSDPLELMTRPEVAALLRVTPQAMAQWRSAGVGPACIKLGDFKTSKVRYRRCDVEAWIESRRNETSKEAVA